MEQERDDAKLVAPAGAQTNNEGTPLRRYLAALYEGGEAAQLLRSIGVLVHRAGLTVAQSTTEIALEILHEVVAEVLKKEESFDPTRNGRAWLLGFANNIVMRRRDKLFRLNKRETVESDFRSGASSSSAPRLGADGSSASGADAEALGEEEIMDRLLSRIGTTSAPRSPEQQVVEAMTWEALLSQLAPEDRRVIELNIFYDMKAVEVAHELGIQVVNARVRLSRALKKLRALYMEQEKVTSTSTARNSTKNTVISEEKHSHE